MAVDRFERLESWQQAHALVLSVCKATATIGGDERYALVPQMRRAAVSIPANIAGAFKRRAAKEKAHFYNIAQSSLEELRYYFILCRDLGYSLPEDCATSRFERVARLLSGLVRGLKPTA